MHHFSLFDILDIDLSIFVISMITAIPLLIIVSGISTRRFIISITRLILTLQIHFAGGGEGEKDDRASY